MSGDAPDVRVLDDPQAGRYEIRVDGETAGFTAYRGHDGMRTFTHTEIDPAFEGRGLGTTLIREALDDARGQGLHVIPMCPFVRAFVAEHEDYLDLVEPRIRHAFGLPAG